jgi:hypothetical protein
MRSRNRSVYQIKKLVEIVAAKPRIGAKECTPKRNGVALTLSVLVPTPTAENIVHINLRRKKEWKGGQFR